MGIVHGEIGDDDGYGECNGEDTAESTESPHEHAHVGFGGHVPIAHCGHCDQCPPEAERNAVEIIFRIGLNSFGIVHEAGKDHDTQCQEKYQERQLFG